MSDVKAMFTVDFTGLTNGQTYYARVYTMSVDGYMQSEVGTQVGSATPADGISLSALPEGAVVMLEESGSPVAFYVAKHDYESGLNGAGRTLLVRKECYDLRAFHSTQNNSYSTSDINTWLNEDYRALFDSHMQTAIGTTKFYNTVGHGNSTITTLERNIFLLSLTELGGAHNVANTEGTVLPISSTLKVALLNGSAVTQWTRTPINGSSGTYLYYVMAMSSSGSTYYKTATASNGARPAFTLPSTTKFRNETNADGSYSIL